MLWMVTLLGAFLVAALRVVKYERWWHVPTPGSAFVDATMRIACIISGARRQQFALRWMRRRYG
jgi:membrane protein